MNTEIRQTMQANHIPQWRVADALGVSENTLHRWLRHQLTGERKQQVTEALDKLIDNGRDQRVAD